MYIYLFRITASIPKTTAFLFSLSNLDNVRARLLAKSPYIIKQLSLQHPPLVGYVTGKLVRGNFGPGPKLSLKILVRPDQTNHAEIMVRAENFGPDVGSSPTAGL